MSVKITVSKKGRMSLLSLFTFNTCLMFISLQPVEIFLSFYHACSYFAVFQSYPFVLFLFLTGVFSCYSYLECSPFVVSCYSYLECSPFVPIDVSYRGGLTKLNMQLPLVSYTAYRLSR